MQTRALEFFITRAHSWQNSSAVLTNVKSFASIMYIFLTPFYNLERII